MPATPMRRPNPTLSANIRTALRIAIQSRNMPRRRALWLPVRMELAMVRNTSGPYAASAPEAGYRGLLIERPAAVGNGHDQRSKRCRGDGQRYEDDGDVAHRGPGGHAQRTGVVEMRGAHQRGIDGHAPGGQDDIDGQPDDAVRVPECREAPGVIRVATARSVSKLRESTDVVMVSGMACFRNGLACSTSARNVTGGYMRSRTARATRIRTMIAC